MANAGSSVHEGRLEESGVAATGRYDFEILPDADAALGGPIAATIRFEGVEVAVGRLRLDFDPAARVASIRISLRCRVWAERFRQRCRRVGRVCGSHAALVRRCPLRVPRSDDPQVTSLCAGHGTQCNGLIEGRQTTIAADRQGRQIQIGDLVMATHPFHVHAAGVLQADVV
jgi:hypothetical protein